MKLANSCLELLMFPQHGRSSLDVLSLLLLSLMGNSSNKTVVGSNNTGSNNTVGSDDRGVVDDMVGGVGGSPGVHIDLGHMMDLMVNLVSNQTGLRYQVGLHSLVDGGSGDSSHSRGVVDNGGNNWGNSDSWGSMDSCYRGSMNSSYRGSMDSSHTMTGIAETMSSVTQTMSGKTQTVSGITQTMSGKTYTVSGITKTMSGKAKNSGIGISGWCSQGGPENGGKNNKGVHLAVS